jgi:hypothetical protein
MPFPPPVGLLLLDGMESTWELVLRLLLALLVSLLLFNRISINDY